MHKLWLIAKHEYLKTVRKRSFLWGTLGIPLFMVVITGISIAVAIGGSDGRPVGYVDQAGVLDAALLPELKEGEEMVELRAFADQEAARTALEAGQIQAFYVLPADYEQSLQVELYYWDDPPDDAALDDFDRFLSLNLVHTWGAGLSDQVRERVLAGTELVVLAADGSREFSERAFVNLILPIVAGFFFMFAVISSSGYMLRAVADEKENRTVEIMATSLSPMQLVGGKALGAMAVSLTQLAVWSLTIVVGLIVGAQFFEPLQEVQVPWSFLLVAALYFFPSFALIAGLMTAIGAAVTEVRQGQQIVGVLNLFFMAPFFFLVLILEAPKSPILVFLTLFPTTSFLTILMRWGTMGVPIWQMVVGWVLLVASAGFSVWAAASVFRLGMLRYGQRLDMRAVLRALQGKEQVENHA